jgi:heat shock protein HslJ
MRIILGLIVLMCLICACKSAKTTTSGGNDADQLYLHRWNLTELRGTPVKVTDRVQPHLLFEPGDAIKISGSVGCNLLAGTVSIKGNTIKFSPLITTKMACPDQNLEYQFSGVLEQINTWAIEGSFLLLKIGEKTAVRLEATNRMQ